MNAQAAPLPVSSAAVDYPVHLEITHQRRYHRFRPLFKVFLLLPHYPVIAVLVLLSYLTTILAAVSVLLTRHYPKGLFLFNVGVARWMYRVSAYLYLMADKYPPFSLANDPDYPVQYSVDFPEHGRIARWRPLLAWLLALPVLLVATVLQYVMGIVLLVVLVSILFTKRYPVGLFNLTRGIMRIGARANAYMLFQVDRYPPFDIA